MTLGRFELGSEPVRRIFAAASVLALMAASAQAQSQVEARGALGAGGTLCSQYTRAARSSDILYHQASSWLLGYLSGLNEAFRAAGQRSPLDGLTSHQVLRTASEYCEANPASTVANATSLWRTAATPTEATPKQAETKKEDDNWVRLNLTAPARKPLLDRR
jgi:hypothetical protein